MEEDKLMFYADNYCPGEIYKKGPTYKTCGPNGNKKDSCIECWKRTIKQRGKPKD